MLSMEINLKKKQKKFYYLYTMTLFENKSRKNISRLAATTTFIQKTQSTITIYNNIHSILTWYFPGVKVM